MQQKEYETAVNSFLDDIYRLALSITCNDADAKDVCQNVFLKLYKSDKSFKSQEHLKNWLLKCAANEARSIHRSFWKRNVNCSLPEGEIKDQDLYPAGKELFGLIARLPKAERTVIHLFYFEGYTTQEIADLLSLSQSAVTTRLYRARKKLKVTMEGEFKDA